MSHSIRSMLAARPACWALLASLAVISAALCAPASGFAATGAAAASWGENYRAQLGAGFKSNYEENAGPVVGLTNATALDAGAGFSLALLSDGTVRAWGGNTWGQLGDGTHLGSWNKPAPLTTVKGLSGVTAIAVANESSLALLANGTLEAWGNNNDGQLANGKGGTEHRTGENQTLAKPVPGLSGVIAIAAGGGSDFALLSNHTVMAWGRNNAGQLGIGVVGPESCLNELSRAEPCSTIPRPVGTLVTRAGKTETEPLSGVAAITAASESAYALLANHHLDAWGSNKDGQVGSGVAAGTNLPSPQVVLSAGGTPLGGVASVSAGGSHALALLETGQVVGWGENANGESGEVNAQPCPGKTSCILAATPLPGLTNVSSVSAGSHFSLVVIAGRVYSFGENQEGQLGTGNTKATAVPTAIGGLGAVSAVAAGSTHALALLAPGVAPPPALLSVEPGVGTLVLNWSLKATAFRIGDRVAGQKLLERVLLGSSERRFTFTRLQTQPYEVIMIAESRGGRAKRRAMIGLPLV